MKTKTKKNELTTRSEVGPTIPPVEEWEEPAKVVLSLLLALSMETRSSTVMELAYHSAIRHAKEEFGVEEDRFDEIAESLARFWIECRRVDPMSSMFD